METAIIAALVSAATTLIAAVLGFFFSLRIEAVKSKLATAVREADDVLDARKGLRDARRAYEFEARKRLYEDLEPLLFQGSEAAQNLFNRVANIARSARLGHLGNREASWLAKGHSEYYRMSLLHRLLTLWALQQLVSRRLTHVDQSLDPAVGSRVAVQSILYEVLSDHFHLAAAQPPIPYDPYIEADTIRQGVARGVIDSAAASLLSGDRHGADCILDLGQFQQNLSEMSDPRREAVNQVSVIFDDFHPATHPVLWRSLVACAALSWVLIKLAKEHERNPKDLVKEFFADPRVYEKFDWRGDQSMDRHSVEPPESALKAARFHILERLEWQDDPIRAGLERR
jgi:hypothetical protein